MLTVKTFYRVFPPLLLLAITLGLAVMELPRWLQALPFALSIVIIGMAHGAIDFSVTWNVSQAENWREAARSFLWYLVSVGLCLVAFMLFPVITLAAFLVVTIQHFGAADFASLWGRYGSPLFRQIWTISRGSLLIGVPLAFHPEQSTEVINSLLFLVNSPVELSADAIASVGMSCAAVACVTGLLAFTKAPSPRWWNHLMELLEATVLLGTLILLPPLLSLGLYFLCWHSVRHFGELAENLYWRNDETPWQHFRTLLRIQLAALPLLLPTWAVLTAIAILWLPEFTIFWFSMLALAAYIVLTLPHDRLVARLHQRARQQRR